MGYYEKIARINLTTGEIKVEKLDVELAKKFIGCVKGFFFGKDRS